MARHRPARVCRAGAAVSVAACCTAIAVLAVASLTACGSSGRATATAVSAAQADPVAACGKPSTSFARFWVMTAEPVSGLYQGTVRVGSARVPGMSMYVSGGSPGTGTFCVSARAGSHDPIQSMAAPRSGAIAYIGAARNGGAGNIVYFATRPGVARVTTTIEGRVSTYRLHEADEAGLQPLGNGWHAVGTGFGIDGAPFTLRAYNSAGELVDTVTETYTGAQPSISQPPVVRCHAFPDLGCVAHRLRCFALPGLSVAFCYHVADVGAVDG
jgi:hypothetical protein